ncbi:tetratricopeptide repeat protein [Orientia tsutsugamushi]|uniref:tetratricopeptide repeat protein n=1 Tax=Orientia tsutsugamushi TaxID=784 RepID=UPI000304CED6|nr:tetratricopeptide repeat protein [Orientia tsutsugamushi]
MLADKYFNKGNSFFQLRKYQKAIKNFDIAIKCNPDCIEAYINKGMALKALWQHQKAIETFDTTI